MSSVINSFRKLLKRRLARSFPASSSRLFSSPAPGSQPISGRYILCNPNPFYPHILFYRSSPPFCVRVEILCKPKFLRSAFPPFPQGRSLSVFPEPLFKLLSRFFAPNLNLYLALLLPINIFLLLWLDWLFLIRSIFIGMTDKGKPFERMGRKTTDLSNGGWVAELISRISLAHSFEVKTGLFFMRNPGAIRRPAMNIPRSLIIKHTDLDPSYIPLAYRREVLERDQGSCHFCVNPTNYLCHDLAKCRGGQTTPDNLLTCCVTCRREKGELTAAEYRVLRLEYIDFPKEVKAMRVEVIWPSGKKREGIVNELPPLGTKAFYLRKDGNGQRRQIYTMPGMEIIELEGKTKGGNL